MLYRLIKERHKGDCNDMKQCLECLAKKLNFTLEYKGIYQRPHLYGNHKNNAFSIYFKRKANTLIVTTPLDVKSPCNLDIFPKTFTAWLTEKIFGSLKTCNQEFNNKFLLCGNPEDMVKYILTPDILNSMLEFNNIDLHIPFPAQDNITCEIPFKIAWRFSEITDFISGIDFKSLFNIMCTMSEQVYTYKGSQ